MTDTTNWSCPCPMCGKVISGNTHICGRPQGKIQHPLEAENARLRAALDVAVERLVRMKRREDAKYHAMQRWSDAPSKALAAIRQKMQEPPQKDGSAPD